MMIPLVDYEQELEIMRELVVRVGGEEGAGRGLTPADRDDDRAARACFVADRIAEQADFFSFGTNDLTQTALGFSRDDVESKFVLGATWSARSSTARRSRRSTSPGVGWLVRLAAWVGREAKPDLKLGICGEHGGDPESIAFFHMAGLDYVWCSPYRVPVARGAAARAALRGAMSDEQALLPLGQLVVVDCLGDEQRPQCRLGVALAFAGYPVKALAVDHGHEGTGTRCRPPAPAALRAASATSAYWSSAARLAQARATRSLEIGSN